MCLAGLVTLTVALTAAPVAFAQDGGDRDPPRFRASVELVQLDVVVTGKNGRPITTLALEDFEVKQDGKPQVVRFVEYVRVARESGPSEPTTRPPASTTLVARAASAPPPAPASTPAPTVSADTPGRHIAVVVDERFMNFDSVVRTRDALTSFVADVLSRGDSIAIVGNNGPAHAPLEFTADRDRLNEQIARLWFDAIPASRAKDPRFGAIACSTPRLTRDVDDNVLPWGTLSLMAPVLRQMRALPGRKAVFLFSEAALYWCPDIRQDFAERLRRLSDMANRSSTVIYSVQTTPWSSGVVMPEIRADAAYVRGVGNVHPRAFVNRTNENLRILSERTGGFAMRSNDLGAMLRAAHDAQQGYYLVAYEPPADTFSGDELRYRKIHVKVKGDGLTVRARAGFYNVSDEGLRK
jgi:VWFA-related protein